MQLTTNTSLKIVENTKVTCINCLLSSPFTDDIFYCELDPLASPPNMTHKDKFCKEGMWICGGAVKDFKEAFTYMYGGKGHPKDLEREEK
jgi:hypothetical protein